MLYVIGLGLSDEKDITVKGLEVSPVQSRLDMPSPGERQLGSLGTYKAWFAYPAIKILLFIHLLL